MREKERLLEGGNFFLLNVDNILAHLENIFVNCLLADAKIKLKSENKFFADDFFNFKKMRKIKNHVSYFGSRKLSGVNSRMPVDYQKITQHVKNDCKVDEFAPPQS